LRWRGASLGADVYHVDSVIRSMKRSPVVSLSRTPAFLGTWLNGLLRDGSAQRRWAVRFYVSPAGSRSDPGMPTAVRVPRGPIFQRCAGAAYREADQRLGQVKMQFRRRCEHAVGSGNSRWSRPGLHCLFLVVVISRPIQSVVVHSLPRLSEPIVRPCHSVSVERYPLGP
jgi:hypothetical protein